MKFPYDVFTPDHRDVGLAIGTSIAFYLVTKSPTSSILCGSLGAYSARTIMRGIYKLRDYIRER